MTRHKHAQTGLVTPSPLDRWIDATLRAFAIQVRWNGILQWEQELKGLGGSSGNELRTVLFVQGSKGSAVDVAFDDYRLERRKEINR